MREDRRAGDCEPEAADLLDGLLDRLPQAGRRFVAALALVVAERADADCLEVPALAGLGIAALRVRALRPGLADGVEPSAGEGDVVVAGSDAEARVVVACQRMDPLLLVPPRGVGAERRAVPARRVVQYDRAAGPRGRGPASSAPPRRA